MKILVIISISILSFFLLGLPALYLTFRLCSLAILKSYFEELDKFICKGEKVNKGEISK